MNCITVNDWRRLGADEREKYCFVSDESGCFFKKMEPTEPMTEEEIDEFEKLLEEDALNG